MKIEVNTLNVEALFENLSADKPVLRAVLARIIRKVANNVRKNARKDIKNYMDSDTRQASQAVKVAVYKSIMGGNVSILDPKKASSWRCTVNKTRKLDSDPHMRGGNRVPRSKRTEELDGYFGTDRAFVLRFLSQGADRTKSNMRVQGNRRVAAHRNVLSSRFNFESIAQGHLDKELDSIEELASQEIQKMLSKINK